MPTFERKSGKEGGERRGEEAARQGDDESPPVYHSIT
jgi:hypothetical protein